MHVLFVFKASANDYFHGRICFMINHLVCTFRVMKRKYSKKKKNGEGCISQFSRARCLFCLTEIQKQIAAADPHIKELWVFCIFAWKKWHIYIYPTLVWKTCWRKHKQEANEPTKVHVVHRVWYPTQDLLQCSAWGSIKCRFWVQSFRKQRMWRTKS